MKTFLKRNGFLIFMLTLFIGYDYVMPTDSTDKDKHNRSGLSLYIDHGTGVHYVKGGFFGTLVPRLNSDGTLYKGK